MQRIAAPKLPAALLVPAAAAVLLSASTAFAGDPIPDVDVILEQIPGGELMRIEETTGHRFDRVEFEDLPREFVRAMDGAPLPAGWELRKEGRRVWLEGPPPGRPVRLKVRIGDVERPKKMSYEVSLEGRRLLGERRQPVKTVVRQEVFGSLQGIVEMPTQVEPGGPLRITSLDPSALPAGGTWTLSGTVTAEEEGRDDAGGLALVVPAEHAERVPDRALEDVAAALAGRGTPEGTWEVVPLGEGGPPADPEPEVWALARTTAPRQAVTRSGASAGGVDRARRDQERDDRDVAEKPKAPGISGQGSVVSQAAKMRHDAAMAAIRNIKAIASPAGGDGGGRGVFVVRPAAAGDREAAAALLVVTGFVHDGEDAPHEEPPAPGDEAALRLFGCKSSQQSRRCCRKAGGGWLEDEEMGGFCFERLEPVRVYLEPIPLEADAPRDPGAGRKVRSFEVRGPEASGGEQWMAIVNTTRSHLKTRPASAAAVEAVAGGDGAAVFASLPIDLHPGDRLALRYVDRFGDVVVDVPAVPDVEVVAPLPDAAPRTPRITGASQHAVAGQLACVCGSFPAPEAWAGVLLDGAAAPAPVSASSRMVWVQLPPDTAPGEHLWSGAPAAGFPPADRAGTLVLQVSGELDSSKLQRLETTPVRLRVEGTERPIELRLRNLTPSIITIEGGPDQTIRTSGGPRNQLERTVRGIAPGAFNINYELAGQKCSCGGGAATD
jgi:hypothetical protein